MLRIPRPKFSLRTALVLFTLAGLTSAAAAKLVDYGHEFERQQKKCDELVRSLGGTRTLMLDRDHPPSCGTYSRPVGLEFVFERRTTGLAHLYRNGIQEITEVRISPANWNRGPNSPEREAVFRRLAELKTLTAVHFWLDEISARDLAPLCELPGLEQLTLHHVSAESADAALEVVGKMSHLRELDIDRAHGFLTDQYEFAETWSGKSLDKPSGLTEKGLGHLAQLPRLRRLRLSRAWIGDGVLGSLKALESLTLSGCRLSSEAYDGLAKCGRLEELESYYTPLGTNGAACIGAIPKLRKLALHESLTNEHLHAICARRLIEDLTLGNLDQLTSEGVTALRTLPITRLALWRSRQESPEVFADLSTVATLRQLTIWPITFNSGYVTALSNLTQLDKLSINHTEVTPEQLVELQTALPKTTIEATVSVSSAVRVTEDENADEPLSDDQLEDKPTILESADSNES